MSTPSNRVQYYYRPTHCRLCDRIFDFPTWTKDATESNVPTRVRYCNDCLWEMGQNEELRLAMMASTTPGRPTSRLLDHSVASTENQDQTESSTTLTNPTTSSDSNTQAQPNDSPGQPQPRLRESSAQSEAPSSSDSRASSDLHNILN